MKLNPDCVRDTLIVLEDYLDIAVGNSSYRFIYANARTVIAAFQKKGLPYDHRDVLYTLIQLSESGYISTDFSFTSRGFIDLSHIFYITPKGHELLASIHDADTWKAKIRPALNKFGTISLSVLETVAGGVSTGIVENLLKV